MLFGVYCVFVVSIISFKRPCFVCWFGSNVNTINPLVDKFLVLFCFSNTHSGIPVDILQETSKEITQQVLPVATTALKAYIIHVGKIPDISTVEGIRTCTDIRSVQDGNVRRAVEEGAAHTTQVVAGL